ncbi:MAG: RibD family protein [Rhodocyclaceae bacterium]
MSAKVLSVDSAWSLLLEARSRDWCGRASLALEQDGMVLEITRDGAWFSAAEVLPEAVSLLDGFAPLVVPCERLAIAQLGQSLDGRIATECGASHYINGVAARTHLHRLRAVVDAVVVGVGTANADDPRLSVRHVPGPQPARVILDPRGRAEPGLQLFHDDLAPVLQLVAAGAAVCPAGVRRCVLAAADGVFEPAAVLDALAARGLTRVLVEGGGATVSRFVAAGVLDRLHVLVAPMLIGSGRAGLSLPVIDSLDSALRPACRIARCGEDVLFDLDLRPRA